MSADECLAHKWLREESPVKSLSATTNCELLLTDCCDVLNECIDNDDNKSIISNGSSASYLKQKLNNGYQQQQATEVNATITVTTSTNGTAPHTNGKLIEQHQNGHKDHKGFFLHEKNHKQTTSNCIQLNSDTNNKENISENRNVVSKILSATTNATDVRRQSITSTGSNSVTITNHSDNHSTTNSFTLDIVDETVTTVQPTASSLDDTSIHLSNVVSTQATESTLFPDAPTTPKVCRKSTNDSPTSVKNLVKKFQLDNQKDCNNIDAIHNTTANSSMYLDMDCSGTISPKKEHLITSSGIVKKTAEALAHGGDPLGFNKIHKATTVTNGRASIGMTCVSTMSPNKSTSSSSAAVVVATSSSTTSSSATSPASNKCACGKLPTSCCCHLLGLRGKSMVVIDNSIVC